MIIYKQHATINKITTFLSANLQFSSYFDIYIFCVSGPQEHFSKKAPKPKFCSYFDRAYIFFGVSGHQERFSKKETIIAIIEQHKFPFGSNVDSATEF